jgi:hypothetical protein
MFHPAAIACSSTVCIRSPMCSSSFAIASSSTSAPLGLEPFASSIARATRLQLEGGVEAGRDRDAAAI